MLTTFAVRFRRGREVIEASFAGRWVELLLEIQFVDRSVALGAKALLALLPALVTVAAFAPSSMRLSMASTLQRRMGLSGDALDLVRAGFAASDQGSVSAGVVGGLFTVVYATTFTSALRRMYLHAWGQPVVRDRMAHFKGLVWIGTVVVLAASVPVLVDRLDRTADWVVLTVIVIPVMVGMWWSTSFLMLSGHVRWRVLLPPAVVTTFGSTLYGAVGALWMPRTVLLSEAQYGYFGVFMTIVSWLVGLAFVVVGSTALGPVLAHDGGAIGRLVRGSVDDVTAPGGRV